MAFTDESLLIFDGACGTTLQSMNIAPSAWGDLAGCNEFLNISAPEYIIELHKKFLEAGAMVVETNTFGASSIVLTEYGLENKVDEINREAVKNAKKAISQLKDSSQPRYIAGSIGPTTKLPSLGHIETKVLAQSIREQVISLLEAGVDALIVETCQDLLQLKTALISCFEILDVAPKKLPVLASVTFEKQGTMLLGTDIAAVCATLAPFPLFSLGLNCATGPTDMVSQIQYLSQTWDKRISCIPNQGMPELKDGKTHYPLSPEEYSQHMLKFVAEYGVSIVGGCCGTGPEHIRQLATCLRGQKPQRQLQTNTESII
ncbi:homocysteine S-methyltransferase family protein [Desulfotalea psychrophila]|uniref:Methionine synthase n=1 Tax=Desulfotalea psychrophila (strain LSv54 / DSM 12343) TaxID=177439 RepID=Q6AL45_DESPS|nr:homocysteine S-methyltransferase family protein [Desulfotalea psychrophila]CAG36930.1 related to 5-methyltetrahydrofolate--homocysteine methyltransferase [Desulfotalea psychrophila LSv54]